MICRDLPTCKYLAQQKQKIKTSEQYIFLSYPPAPFCLVALSSTLPTLWEVENGERKEKKPMLRLLPRLRGSYGVIAIPVEKK